MKDNTQSLNALADSKPVITGLIGTTAGWGAAAISYMQQATTFFTFIAAMFGAITAIYTTIIVIRRYHIGVTDDKNVDNARK